MQHINKNLMAEYHTELVLGWIGGYFREIMQESNDDICGIVLKGTHGGGYHKSSSGGHPKGGFLRIEIWNKRANEENLHKMDYAIRDLLNLQEENGNQDNTNADNSAAPSTNEKRLKSLTNQDFEIIYKSHKGTIAFTQKSRSKHLKKEKEAEIAMAENAAANAGEVLSTEVAGENTSVASNALPETQNVIVAAAPTEVPVEAKGQAHQQVAESSTIIPEEKPVTPGTFTLNADAPAWTPNVAAAVFTPGGALPAAAPVAQVVTVESAQNELSVSSVNSVQDMNIIPEKTENVSTATSSKLSMKEMVLRQLGMAKAEGTKVEVQETVTSEVPAEEKPKEVASQAEEKERAESIQESKQTGKCPWKSVK